MGVGGGRRGGHSLSATWHVPARIPPAPPNPKPLAPCHALEGGEACEDGVKCPFECGASQPANVRARCGAGGSGGRLTTPAEFGLVQTVEARPAVVAAASITLTTSYLPVGEGSGRFGGQPRSAHALGHWARVAAPVTPSGVSGAPSAQRAAASDLCRLTVLFLFLADHQSGVVDML